MSESLSLIAALDDCLNALEAGASLEAALARYPALADELRPMLIAAQAARPAEPIRVPRQSEDASRARFLARAQVLRASRPRPRRLIPWLAQGLRPAALAIAVIAAGLLSAYGTLAAAAQSLPGDLLYDVKRSVEQVQLSLAGDPAARTALEREFEQRRLDEVRAVVEQRRPVTVSFRGVVEQQNGDRWVVAGLPVIVPAGLGSGLSRGQAVTVAGAVQPDGAILAAQIRPDDSGVTATDTPPAPPRLTRTLTPAPTMTRAPDQPATETAEPQRPTQTTTPTRTPTLRSSSGPSPSSTPPAISPSPAATQTPPAPPTPTSGGGPAPIQTLPLTQTPVSATPTETPEPEDTDEPDDEEEFEGVVEATGGVWVISGQSVTITSETEFRGNPQLGDRVKVKAWRMGDGSLAARRIEKED